MKEKETKIDRFRDIRQRLYLLNLLNAPDPFDWITEAMDEGNFKYKTEAVHATSVEPIDIESDEYKWLRDASTSQVKLEREPKMADERFQGDMSRNEVEIDLNKFMAMVSEIGDLKQTIMEMENEREPENPYQKWIWLSNMIDAWRIFPRAFLSVYIFLLYYATMWFMDLPDPTLEQSGLISVIVGAGAAWFGLYAGTAKDKINSK